VGKFPINQVIRARWWQVPSGQVPRDADHETQLQWLYHGWEQIDNWITENRPGGVVIPAVAPLPGDETAEPDRRVTPPQVCAWRSQTGKWWLVLRYVISRHGADRQKSRLLHIALPRFSRQRSANP
jgi:hypothetical protein